jgi:hypothetical protein
MRYFLIALVVLVAVMFGRVVVDTMQPVAHAMPSLTANQ